MSDNRQLPILLVVGASGFIGGSLVRLLRDSGEFEVRAGMRHPIRATLPGDRLSVVHCDLQDISSLDSALRQVAVVVHCARGVGNNHSPTTKGTRLLLDRAKLAGVRHVIFMSSVAVYGDAVGLVHEDTVPVGRLSSYGRAKAAAELACREAVADGIAVTVVRPTLVYGPGSTQWTLPYLHRFSTGKWPILGERGEGTCNLIFVDDLARLATHLARKPAEGFTVFIANGPEAPTWNSYLERLNHALGYPPFTRRSHCAVSRAVASYPVRVLSRLVNRLNHSVVDARAPSPLYNRITALLHATASEPSLHELRHFARKVLFSNERIVSHGIAPQVSVDEGIRLTVEWARHSGLLTP